MLSEQEALALSREVSAGKARSYVGASKQLAEYVLARAKDLADLMAYVDDAKREADKRGRVCGQPLNEWIASLPLDIEGREPIDATREQLMERFGITEEQVTEYLSHFPGSAPLLTADQAVAVGRSLLDGLVPPPKEERPGYERGKCVAPASCIACERLGYHLAPIEWKPEERVRTVGVRGGVGTVLATSGGVGDDLHVKLDGEQDPIWLPRVNAARAT